MSYSNTQTGDKAADPYTQKNLDDPPVEQKVKDLLAFVEKCKFCMMTTRIASSGLLVSRCMALAAKVRFVTRHPETVEHLLTRQLTQEGNGIDLLFHANTESGKTDDLQSDSKINLGFLNSLGEWASISGEASIETDRETIRKYYSPGLKAWIGDLGDGKHDGGPDDPRICLIKVKAITAQYAVSNRTLVGELVEFAKGVVTGEVPNVNKLRHLSEQELLQWRSKS